MRRSGVLQIWRRTINRTAAGKAISEVRDTLPRRLTRTPGAKGHPLFMILVPQWRCPKRGVTASGVLGEITSEAAVFAANNVGPTHKLAEPRLCQGIGGGKSGWDDLVAPSSTLWGFANRGLTNPGEFASAYEMSTNPEVRLSDRLHAGAAITRLRPVQQSAAAAPATVPLQLSPR